MGALTHIQWATHTFNPWVGCTKVSPGCTNCYAEAYDRRIGGVPVALRNPNSSGPELRWGVGARRTRTSPAYWRQPLKWNRIAAELGERHRVFCASLADVFDSDGVEVSWLADLARLIEQTPSLDWLLLTKRPENFWRWKAATGQSASDPVRWPDNVWLGVTVENRVEADHRLPFLLDQKSAVRFLSCEPLLGAVDLRPWLAGGHAIDWVIVGGESGPKARPFHLEWAEDLVEQCEEFGAAPFVKQLGACATWDFYEHRRWADHNGFDVAEVKAQGWAEDDIQPPPGARSRFVTRDRSGGEWTEWPKHLQVRHLPEVA